MSLNIESLKQPNEGSITDHSILKKSRLTIRTKLLVIISFIILFSLSLIIGLASYFFKKDSRSRIEENSAQITRILSSRIKDKFLDIATNMKLLGENLESIHKMDAQKQEEIRNILFGDTSDIVFVGIYKEADGKPVPINSISNSNFISKYSLNGASFTKAIEKLNADLSESFNGATVLRNASSTVSHPVIAMSIPYKQIGGSRSILIIFIKTSSVQHAFLNSGISTTYMTDEKGTVLAHPEDKVVLEEKSFAKDYLFKAMSESKFNNNQTNFKVEDESYLGSFKKLEFSGGAVFSIVQEDRVFEEVYNLQRRNIYLMIVVLMLAVLIVYFYARSLSEPILKLVGASKEVEKGNYHVKLPIQSGDEIGVLTHSFNKMSKGLDEREKMKEAFGKFVNKDIAELAMKGEIKLGGERKYCSIFFSDIRSFTSISEKLEPEEVVEFLNQYMTEMVKCVNATNGIVDKFIGDAIMATWGALNADENAVENSINASLMMRQSLLQFNKGRGTDKKPTINIGCGINSGFVISGQIGSNERLEYTVIGDAVNLASRIESLNKPFGTDILISQDAYDKVKSIFKVEKMQAIKVKGKTEPQTIYAVLGRKDDPKCISSLKELRELIGMKFEEPEKSAVKGKKAKSNVLDEEKEEKYEILE